jgi:hypothetical protein
MEDAYILWNVTKFFFEEKWLIQKEEGIGIIV